MEEDKKIKKDKEELISRDAVRCCSCESFKLHLCEIEVTTKKIKLTLYCDMCGLLQYMDFAAGKISIPKIKREDYKPGYAG